MLYRLLTSLYFMLMPFAVGAQSTSPADATPPAAGGTVEQEYISYQASYFDRIQPVTAFDMVKQVPGFQLDDAINDVRGFGTASGNILIDDRRPSTKRDSLTAILTRIPASSVERIELIRGQVRNIDMRGQSSMLNIILHDGIPASVQWELASRQTFGHGPLKPEGGVSLADNWKGIDYNVGLDTRWSSVGRKGIDDILDANDVLEEERMDKRDNRNTVYKANLNAAGWLGENYIQLNTVYNYSKQHTFTYSDRINRLSSVERNVFFDDIEKEPVVEAGLDVERELATDFIGKAILLYVHGNRDIFNSQRDTSGTGAQTLYRLATGDLKSTEAIARLEFDWSGFDNHALQFNVERAANTLDSTLGQTDDRGLGPITVLVPGANGVVEEIRWDTLLKDTWTMGQFELAYGIGTEASTLTQTGDTELERSFFFLKPQAAATWAWQNRDQTRLELVREISQLNLEEFVSATEFLDNDIALGNPNIKPDATWKLELGHEMRFGVKAVVKLTAFHHWIKDTLDFLPITDTFEAIGNIGDGRRLGVLWESSVPLDWVGLRSAKLDLKARLQDSSVTDPVTGEDRVLSIKTISGGPIFFNVENNYAWEMNFRQDFQASKLAWGWKMMDRAEQYQYKADELIIYDENTDIHAYIESSRWFGMKIQFGAENMLNFHEDRYRVIYTSAREQSPVDSTELRDRTRGFRLNLTLSGSF